MTVLINQARVGSTRLPGKTMKEILGKPLLYYSVRRAMMAKHVDKVVVATTTNPKDDVIVKWCEENEIPYYRGSEDDVLDRYYNAAKKFGANIIVRITSDCPFIDPEIIDLLILTLKTFEYDYVSNRVEKRTFPHGLDAEVFTFEALEIAGKNAKKPQEREHVTPYFLAHPELFNIYEVSYKKDLSNIRLTVDYKEDFEMAKELMRILIEKFGENFSWKDILKIYEKNTDIFEINKGKINTKLI